MRCVQGEAFLYLMHKIASERKSLVKANKLCFNRLGNYLTKYQSVKTCVSCKARHYSLHITLHRGQFAFHRALKHRLQGDPPHYRSCNHCRSTGKTLSSSSLDRPSVRSVHRGIPSTMAVSATHSHLTDDRWDRRSTLRYIPR